MSIGPIGSIADEERRAAERRRPTADRRIDIPTTRFTLPPKDDREDVREVRCYGTFDDVLPLLIVALQRDSYTQAHLLHVNRVAASWAQVLPIGAAEREILLQASVLHDVGKIVVEDDIIMAPRSLTAAEYAAVQEHVAYGVRLLTPYVRLARVALVIGQHHEWFNGCGYPNQLAGEAIDPIARAVSVIDAYSAMTVDRPYHRGIAEDAALREIERASGTQFDPTFAQSFIEFRKSQSHLRRY